MSAKAVARRPTLIRRGLRRMESWKAYPRSWLLVILGSRAAPWIQWVLALLVLVVVLAAELGITEGKIPTWVPFIGALVLQVASQFWDTLVQGSAQDAYLYSSRRIAGLISDFSGSVREDRVRPTAMIESLLRQVREVTRMAVKVPIGHSVSVNLLLPAEDENGVLILRAVLHDDNDPHRAHEPIPLDAPGAGEAFNTGQPIAVPCTDNCTHPRILGKSYKSIALYPILVGNPANRPPILGVLSIDSTHPFTFSQKTVERKLYALVAPVAQLIGVVLELQQQRREPYV